MTSERVDFTIALEACILPGDLFEAVVASLNYRNHNRTDWAALAVRFPSLAPNSVTRLQWQQFLLVCADAIVTSSTESESLPLLCAAHSILPLNGERLYVLARSVLPTISPETPTLSLPLPPSPRWARSRRPAAEWLDIPVRALLPGSDTSAPVPELLRYACWETLRRWRDIVASAPSPDAAHIHSFLRIAVASCPSPSLLPTWAGEYYKESSAVPKKLRTKRKKSVW